MLYTHYRMALNSLRSNKIRTFLTLLGIIIGVTSVTTIVGLGEGVKRQVGGQISDLGSDLVTIVPGYNVQQRGLDNLTSVLDRPSASSTSLTDQDLKTVSTQPNVVAATGSMQLDASISRAGKNLNTRLLGVDQEYLNVTRQKIAKGQFFGGNLENNQTVVLGDGVAGELFGSQDPIGSTVTIRGNPYTVIGILEKAKGFDFGQPLDRTVLMQINTAKSLNNDLLQLSSINLTLKDVGQAEETATRIKTALLANRAHEEDFTVITQKQLMSTTNEVFRVLTGFTAAVASISLIVGGIGVMNIMLVTVTERTREIGIRKAIGATRSQIMMQFLVEALVISLTGGVIGILFSLLVGYIIGLQTAVKPAMDPWIIGLAALVSFIVGVVFGTWPALRAARKDPIESLRHD